LTMILLGKTHKLRKAWTRFVYWVNGDGHRYRHKVLVVTACGGRRRKERGGHVSDDVRRRMWKARMKAHRYKAAVMEQPRGRDEPRRQILVKEPVRVAAPVPVAWTPTYELDGAAPF
jgi:hypothetical protein